MNKSIKLGICLALIAISFIFGAIYQENHESVKLCVSQCVNDLDLKPEVSRDSFD